MSLEKCSWCGDIQGLSCNVGGNLWKRFFHLSLKMRLMPWHGRARKFILSFFEGRHCACSEKLSQTNFWWKRGRDKQWLSKILTLDGCTRLERRKNSPNYLVSSEIEALTNNYCPMSIAKTYFCIKLSEILGVLQNVSRWYNKKHLQFVCVPKNLWILGEVWMTTFCKFPDIFKKFQVIPNS